MRVSRPAAREPGIVSDLDSTIIPPEVKGEPPPAPYPGMTTLLNTLEKKEPGDVHYVTARSPQRAEGIPEYIAEHGLPEGSIDTGGESAPPWVARPEKVRDISRIFKANPDQKFVLFGDTRHVDPDVYTDIREKFPDQVISTFINHVTNVNPDRVEGHHLIENYAEAAAILYGEGVLTEAQARKVMRAAKAEGLELTQAEMDALISAQS